MTNDNDETMMPFAAADSRQSTVSSHNGNDNPPPPPNNNNEYSPLSPARGEIIGGPNNALGTPATRPREVRGSSGQRFTVWPMSRDSRLANDIVHKDISIPPAVQVVLDSPPVQRLVHLKQLGCAFNAYPCCTHTRKEHSMGVMELAGQVATNIARKQPQFQISEKDILCCRMAGLCHDLGHGPFSHGYEAFLMAAYKNEKENPEMYEERNAKFKEQFGVEMPQLPEPGTYEHEETSLMMIDSALATVGLEIDWDNLDEPLKQIGNGTDREKFGVDLLGQNNIEPFTSRDWVFIKECIYGKPLDVPHAPDLQESFVGRPDHKEFLFTIVNNFYNGLDVDKIDYYGRDSFGANGVSNGNLGIFLRDAVVAWAICPNPHKCFKCKKKNPDAPGRHLMICYPKKHMTSAMNFFGTRITNHENIYTHKKTKGAELQMVDLLLEADKHFCMLLSTQLNDPYGFPVPSRFDGFEFPLLPISRAWMYPRLFLRVDDTIVSILEGKAIENPAPELNQLRQYLNDRRSHKFYKCVAEVEMGTLGEEEIWNMSEDGMKTQLLEEYGIKPEYEDHEGKIIALEREDFIVEKRTLHYGQKEHNPVSQMRFLSKRDQANLSNPIEDLPTAEKVENLPMNTPQSFLRRTIRFFSRKYDKNEIISHSFQSWKYHKVDKQENPTCDYTNLKVFEDEDEDEHTQPDTQPLTQDSLALSPYARKRKNSDDISPIPAHAKKKLSFNIK